MPIINPIYSTTWDPGETIQAVEVNGEFLNIYNLVNGQLDATNIADGSIGTNELASNSVTNTKVVSITANKVTGVLAKAQLPADVVYTGGSTLTGTLVFNVAAGIPWLRTFNNSLQTVLDVGTGVNKILVTLDPIGNTLRITKNGVEFLKLDGDGRLSMTRLIVPVGTGLWT